VLPTLKKMVCPHLSQAHRHIVYTENTSLLGKLKERNRHCSKTYNHPCFPRTGDHTYSVETYTCNAGHTWQVLPSYWVRSYTARSYAQLLVNRDFVLGRKYPPIDTWDDSHTEMGSLEEYRT